MNVVVAGPESSGNRWTKHIFSLHNQANVYSVSYPTQKFKKRKYIDDLSQHFGVKFSSQDYLVVPCRDQTIIKISSKIAGHNEGQDVMAFEQEKTLRKLSMVIDSWIGKHLFFSYETLLTWKKRYLIQVFSIMGLDIEYPYEKIEYKDGNVKYVK